MSARYWTPGRLEALRLLYLREPMAALCRRFGKSEAAITSVANRRLKLVRRPRWTATDRQVVLDHYGKLPTEQIAQRLGRPIGQVYQCADRLGLMRPRPVIDLARLAVLNAQGLTDTEITAELGDCCRSIVSRYRRELGLPSHGHCAKVCRRVAEGVRRQAERLGCANMGEVRAKVLAERVRATGWPVEWSLRLRHCQILDALRVRGPLTRREIAAAIGLAWHGSRLSLKSNDPEGCYLGHLMRKGLVVCLGRLYRDEKVGAVKPGNYRWESVYCIALWAIDLKKREDSHGCRTNKRTSPASA